MTLIGYWPLHDDSAQDYSGNGNHGTLNGSPTTGVAGKGGLQATSFDGSNDYVDTNNGGSFGNPDYTMLVWVRPRTQQYSRLISNYDGGGHDNETAIRLDQNGNGHVSPYLSNGSSQWSVEGTTNVFDSAWHLVGAVRRGDRLEVWVDGDMENSASVSGTSSKSTDHWLGQSPDGGDGYDGMASGLRFYSRALSDAEIQTLYQMGDADLASPPTDGLAYYPLDGDTTDAWGNNDGATSGGLSWSNDAIRGQAADFDGTDDQINTSTNLFDGQDYTISLWVKPSDVSSNQQLILDQDNSTGDLWANVSIANSISGNIEYHFLSDGVNLGGSTPIPKDSWSHFVVTYDSSADDANIYLNGVPAPDEGGKANAEGVYPDLIIGAARESGKNNFNGLMDDFRIYNRSLKPHEVFKLYQWGTRGKDMRKHLVNRRQK